MACPKNCFQCLRDDLDLNKSFVFQNPTIEYNLNQVNIVENGRLGKIRVAVLKSGLTYPRFLLQESFGAI